MTNDYGSAYARQLSDSMVLIPDGMTMGPTDTALCVRALRHYADRWRRRAAALATVAALVVGTPDVNGDGRVSLADLGAAVRGIVLTSAVAKMVP